MRAGAICRRFSARPPGDEAPLRRRAGSDGTPKTCPARGRFSFIHTAMASSLTFRAGNGAPRSSSPLSCPAPGSDAVRPVSHYTRTSIKNGTSAWLKVVRNCVRGRADDPVSGVRPRQGCNADIPGRISPSPPVIASRYQTGGAGVSSAAK